MNIEGKEGTFFFKALVRSAGSHGWDLSETLFDTLENAKLYYGVKFDVKWPVDIIGDGVCYVPTIEEYEKAQK